MNNKYQLILFDMDGTIAYTDEMIIHTMLDLYDLYNPKGKKSREEIVYFSGPPLSVTMPKEFPDLDPKFMIQEFLRISKPYYDKYVIPFEHEIEVLTKLKEKGYKLACVTNKGSMMAAYVLKLIGVDHLLDFAIGIDDVNHPKPHQEGIELAMKRFNILDKSKVIYVGDNDIDYVTSQNAGVDSLICDWGPRKLNVTDKANYVVHSYLEMEKIFL